MKKTLVIYTHPNPASFNAAIKNTAVEALKQAGNEVRERDLYALKFDPVLDGEDFMSFKAGKIPADIAEEQSHVAWADRLLFIYPLWWFDRPALLKGWIDRVFSYGFAFSYGAEGAKGLLKHEKAMVIQTTGGSQEVYEAHHAVNIITSPMKDGTLGFCGIGDVDFHTYYGVVSATQEKRTQMLEEIKTNITQWAA
ncbi:MAG: NAD(P)H-dependent oxidoreductase [Alphaproteobacteria bacterium]